MHSGDEINEKKIMIGDSPEQMVRQRNAACGKGRQELLCLRSAETGEREGNQLILRQAGAPRMCCDAGGEQVPVVRVSL